MLEWWSHWELRTNFLQHVIFPIKILVLWKWVPECWITCDYTSFTIESQGQLWRIQHSLSTAFPFFFLIQAVDRYSFSPISNSSWRRTTSSISFPTLVTSFVSVLERRKCHEKKLVLSASESWIRNWLLHLQLFYYNSLWPQGQRLGISFLCHRPLTKASFTPSGRLW